MSDQVIKALLVGGARDGQVYEFPASMQVINDKEMRPDGVEVLVAVYKRLDEHPDREGTVRFELSDTLYEVKKTESPTDGK